MFVPVLSRPSHASKVLWAVLIFVPYIASCLILNIPSDSEPHEWATAHSEISALRHSLSEGTLGTHRMSGGAANKTIAVFLTGLQQNMLVDNKLKNIVEPVRAQGWDVDVFMEIVGLRAAGGRKVGAGWSPLKNATMEDSVQGTANELLTLLEKNLIMRGARLVHGVVHKSDYNVKPDLAAASELGRLRRMYQYDPFSKSDRLKAKTGQAVLKRFKGLQTLMNVAAATKDYDFVLVTRDTDLWLHKLDMAVFSYPKGPTVFTKGCKSFRGVNDKTFLFTGDASKAVLSHIYDDFFNERYGVLNNIKGAEEYWSTLIKKVHHVHSSPTRPSYIPTADAHWRSTNLTDNEICIKSRYLCTYGLEYEVRYPMC